ncbi:DMT family transporter [Halapricum hydrolyticum]|uniref:DMT family transporter n=1 Tax=Halapricum hydrolyticum TaxID=2979991 RepID=A0AAE3LFF7_9EURY|nr:DMT family transporter [Halapricum hydrolyticum]MCU4718633.1 DMT family transporter [Halapricum hydrolyticum]MCU4727681.1 DMT family transporter [Halapricum hydrolyticum]
MSAISRNRTVGLFLLVTLLFGTAFPAVKTGLSFIPPLLFAATRSYLAAALLLVYVGATTEYWFPRSRRDVTAVLAGGVLLVGGTGIGFVAQQFITAGVAAIIFSLAPIITAVLAWPLLPAERLAGRDYAGVLLGFVGIAVVIRPDPASLLDPELVGKLLFFAGVVVVELGAVLVRRSRTSMPIPALTGWAMMVGGTVHAVFAVGIGESIASVQPTLLAMAMVIYLSVFIGAFGLVMYLVLMGQIGPLKANMTTYLTPIVALAIGWVLLAERIEPLTLVGFGIIVVGFALLESREISAELARYRSLYR